MESLTAKRAGPFHPCLASCAREIRATCRCPDEYDKPLLDVLDTGYSITIDGEKRLLEEHHRNILKGFYSVFKAADEHLQFVLLTGVTKFSQVSVFSGFNQPADISMDPRYETLCGLPPRNCIVISTNRYPKWRNPICVR